MPDAYDTIIDVLGITGRILSNGSLHTKTMTIIQNALRLPRSEVLNSIRVPVSYDVFGSQWGIWLYGYALYPYTYSPNGDTIEGGMVQFSCGGFVYHVMTHAANKDGTEDAAVRNKIIALENIYDGTGMGFVDAESFYPSCNSLFVNILKYCCTYMLCCCKIK